MGELSSISHILVLFDMFNNKKEVAINLLTLYQDTAAVITSIILPYKQRTKKQYKNPLGNLATQVTSRTPSELVRVFTFWYLTLLTSSWLPTIFWLAMKLGNVRCLFFFVRFCLDAKV